jgi:hypothetical protein
MGVKQKPNTKHEVYGGRICTTHDTQTTERIMHHVP